MPLARSRLDCCICIVEETEESVHALRDLLASIQAAHRTSLVLPCGSFHSCSFACHDTLRLYANHQGGYRVRCPLCRNNIAAAFSKSVHRWRAGGSFSMTCPSCAEEYAISKAKGSPPFAFSRAAIVLHDVETAEIGDVWHEQCVQHLGDYRVVFRRIG